MHRAERISRRLKLRQLEVLLAVADSGSMAKAAKQLAISQPVVSKAVAALENTLGLRLFDRTSRGIEPTLYGRALLKRSVALLNDLRAGVTELEFLSDPTAGELRIGSSEAVAAGMLSVIVERLSREHPRIIYEVTLGGGLTDLQYRELQAHNLDLIIGRLPEIVPDDTRAEALYADEFFVLAAAGNRLAGRRKLALADLVSEPWCLPPPNVYPWTRSADAFRAQGLEPPRQMMTTRSVMLLTTMVLTGRFLTILPRTVVEFCPMCADLKALKVDLRIAPYPVGIITLKDRTLSPATQLFIDRAREVAKPLAKSKQDGPWPARQQFQTRKSGDRGG